MPPKKNRVRPNPTEPRWQTRGFGSRAPSAEARAIRQASERFQGIAGEAGERTGKRLELGTDAFATRSIDVAPPAELLGGLRPEVATARPAGAPETWTGLVHRAIAGVSGSLRVPNNVTLHPNVTQEFEPALQRLGQLWDDPRRQVDVRVATRESGGQQTRLLEVQIPGRRPLLFRPDGQEVLDLNLPRFAGITLRPGPAGLEFPSSGLNQVMRSLGATPGHTVTPERLEVSAQRVRIWKVESPGSAKATYYDEHSLLVAAPEELRTRAPRVVLRAGKEGAFALPVVVLEYADKLTRDAGSRVELIPSENGRYWYLKVTREDGSIGGYGCGREGVHDVFKQSVDLDLIDEQFGPPPT